MTSVRVLEDVFVTEGVPAETFVDPPNLNEILVDVRHAGKPVVIEGPSGTGKTTTVKKILERLGKSNDWLYLSARKGDDLLLIGELADSPSPGVFIIDDFHRLRSGLQSALANQAKIAAEENEPGKYPKLVLVGINQVGNALIHFAPDIAKRVAIHRIRPGDAATTRQLVDRGCEALNIKFDDPDVFFSESKGDYWLTQTLCSTACSLAGVLEGGEHRAVLVDLPSIRTRIVNRLEAAYYEPVKDFCRGRRFRPSNDPYYRILRFIAQHSSSSSVDLVELANAKPEIAGSINNIKDGRLTVLLNEKPKAGQYFYYNKETAQFSIEDPAVFYFLRHLDWDKVRLDCGFRDRADQDKRFDVAISFAGENRELARYIKQRLADLDVSVFFDEDYENKYLGMRMGDAFEEIYALGSRFVVCLLDENHRRKIWPTFERDVFAKRVTSGEVLPVFLDDTVFPGIPADLWGIKLHMKELGENWRSKIDDLVVLKLIDRIA